MTAQSTTSRGTTTAQADELSALTISLVRQARQDPGRRRLLLDEVVTLHLPLAERMARRFLHRGEAYDDLVQVARLGLVEAAQRFDPDRGDFVGFATPTISGILKRHFRDHGWAVRPPRRTQELVTLVRQQWSIAAQEDGCAPTAAELARRLDESVAQVIEAQQANRGYRLGSLDAVLDADGRLESEGSANEFRRAEARLTVSRLLAGLTPDDRRLLHLRFVEQRSQAEIAALIGTSQMQVSRLLSRLLTRLRARLGTESGWERDAA